MPKFEDLNNPYLENLLKKDDSDNESETPPLSAKEAIGRLEKKFDAMPPLTPEQIEEVKAEAAEMAAGKAPTPLADWLLNNRRSS